MGRWAHGGLETVEERFWARCEKTASCWLWRGFVSKDGYGVVSLSGDKDKAHRIAYRFAKGRIPDGLLVRHKCHVRNCVNPEHLLLGTAVENAQDMVDANRQHKGPSRSAMMRRCAARGEAHVSAKITIEQVRWARKKYAQGVRISLLAKQLNLTEASTRKAVFGLRWKDVDKGFLPPKKHPPCVGVEHHSARMTPATVRAARLAHRMGETCASLARKYDLDHSSMKKIIDRVSWKHVP